SSFSSVTLFAVLRPPSDRGECGGAHHALVLEVKEQPVTAGTGYLDVKRDPGSRVGPTVAGLAVRVDVQVGQVTLTEGDQVTVRRQVRLQVDDRGAVLRDGQRQWGGRAGHQVAVERDRVPV